MMQLLLSVRNVETWYGPINAIRGVSLELSERSIVAVLGANGAGKTTLLRTIAGVIDPFKGTITFDGAAIHGLDPDEIARRGVVLVPEGRQVFPFLTVRENLLMGAFARRESTNVGQDLDRVFAWFPRLRERALQHAGLLSGGEQQMLAIGRALMSQPRVLLLDEPSLGLSPLITKDIFSIIGRINAETGTSILVVEQNAAMALKHSQLAYIMELGRIVAFGPSEQLMQKQDVKDFYLGEASTTANPRGREQRWKRRKTWR
jgi:branched-chain amino acid transport system ATP-binding protein